MSKGKQEITTNEPIMIVQVDDRGSFRRGDNYPHLIFLSTVLRWTVQGNHILDERNDAIKIARGKTVSSSNNPTKSESDNLQFVQIRKNNDSALASVAALLADEIENGDIVVYSTHAKLPLGSVHKESLVSRLRAADVNNNFSGLAELDDQDYSLDGRMLYQCIMAKEFPMKDYFQQGGIWQSLATDAPAEWRNLPVQDEPITEPDCRIKSADMPKESQHAEEIESDHDEKIAALFDPVTVAVLEKMFSADDEWKNWAERASRNGLVSARQGRAKFNPYKAALWFVNQGIVGWDLARCKRVLINNLPARSRDEAYLLSDKIDY
ncbi:MAG: hypothetical protein WA435_14575 [Gallionellaceae bacterium]